ncbi:MAG: DUF362 domain-containing protein [Deltaproteobacteria bacterium]|nr:DUF362 domain-containing protein [Deltaproteobacteria bacterium]
MKIQPAGILRYESSPGSLRALVEKCGGLKGLGAGDRTFIKPNLVALDESFPIPLYGVVTTTRLVHDMVLLLKEHGVESITIGEGSVYGRNFGVPTAEVFEALGYGELAKRYGVRLLDLHREPFSREDFGDYTLEISEPALSADVLINMPVLKTHNQAVVSLGLKNLKGCLSMKSRKACHAADGGLDGYLARFVEKLTPDLTVIDGIYGLEKGPFYTGTAVRMNALIASTDPLSADLVGAAAAGFDPGAIPHLRLCAGRRARSTDPEPVLRPGDDIDSVRKPLKWDNTWRADDTGPRAWDRLGVQGIRLPKYDATLCTGCSGLYSPILVLIMAAYRGEPFNEIEILTGKAARPSGEANKTLLVGNCMIKANRHAPGIRETVLVKGCPPGLDDVTDALRSCGIEADESGLMAFRRNLAERYKGKPGFDETFYKV